MATFGRILTNDNLWKRQLFVIDWCCMCKRDARELWSTVFSLFGVAWVMPSGVMELLAYW